MRTCEECGKQHTTGRKICAACSTKRTATKLGLTTAEYSRQKKINAASKKGLTTAEYENTTHKYRKHLKDKCDNRDGHLGYKCAFPVKLSKIEGKSVLQVDHVDGNPNNNDLSNLKTYCPSCHRVKTYMNKDHTTPGRKTKK